MSQPRTFADRYLMLAEQVEGGTATVSYTHLDVYKRQVTASSTPDKPVLDRAALALEDWLTAADITEGAIFRRLWKQRLGLSLIHI